MLTENITEQDGSTNIQEDPSTLFYVYYYGIFIIIGCINIPGNILVISTVFRHPVLRLPCNYYIVSLAVSDLLIGVVYPVYNISHLESVPTISLPLGEWKVCRFIVTEVLALEICSSYHLVAITATRYIAIMKPLRYHRYVTTKSTIIIITLIWVLSQGVTIVMYNIVEPTDGYQFCRYELLFSITHVAVLFVIQLFLPLFIMIGLYFRIAKVARAQARIIAQQERGIWSTNGRSGNRNAIRNELKSTIMVSILLGFFAMSWTPMIIYFFYFIICKRCNINRFIRVWAPDHRSLTESLGQRSAVVPPEVGNGGGGMPNSRVWRALPGDALITQIELGMCSGRAGTGAMCHRLIEDCHPTGIDIKVYDTLPSEGRKVEMMVTLAVALIPFFDIFVSGKLLRATVRILLFLNSAVNVFIYAGRLKMFRQSITQDLRGCLRTLTCRGDLEFELAPPRKEQRFSNTNLSYLSDTDVNSHTLRSN